MKKNFLMMITLVLVVTANATANTKVSPKVRHVATMKTPGSECKAFVLSTIVATAKKMGLVGKVGISLSGPEAEGVDGEGLPKYRFSSGHFMAEPVDGEDGFILDSGASAVVHKSNGKCEILELSISIGR